MSLNSAAIADPSLVARIAVELGNQSVAVVLDGRRRGCKGYDVFARNGKEATGRDTFEAAAKYDRLGAGEVVVNSIDNDGMMRGYDLELAQRMRGAITVPMTILGGARSLADLGKLIGRSV